MTPDHRTIRYGHAAKPGSGPQGETCNGCRHYRNDGHWRFGKGKCRHADARQAPEPSAGIRPGDPACNRWAEVLR